MLAPLALFMTVVSIQSKSMDRFLYDRDLRHERVHRQPHKMVKHIQTIRRIFMLIYGFTNFTKTLNAVALPAILSIISQSS